MLICMRKLGLMTQVRRLLSAGRDRIMFRWMGGHRWPKWHYIMNMQSGG
jgi:hypothetical protein